MKKEEKQLVCEHLDKLCTTLKTGIKYRVSDIIDAVEHFKKDNNLLTNMSGWYLNRTDDSLRFFDFEKNINWGIGMNNEWVEIGGISATSLFGKDYYPATRQQVEERLFPFFEKMYPKGTKVKFLNGNIRKVNGTFWIVNNNTISAHFYKTRQVGSPIMQDGILAEIIEENQNAKAIKALDKAIELLMDKKKQLEDGK